MRVSIVLFCVLIVLIAVQATVRIRPHSEEDTHANQYLVFDDYDTAILVDTGSAVNTSALVEFIGNAGVESIDLVFLTSGLPAQWRGVPDIAKAFPDARIAVANRDTKNELLENVAKFPTTSFNYSLEIEILNDDDTFTDLGLTLVDDLPAAQAESYSMLVQRDQNWVITGDALYVETHPYLGSPIDLNRLQTWYGTTLAALLVKGELDADANTIFYPGHGRVASQSDIRDFQEYLQYFETELFTCQLPDRTVRTTLNQIANDLVSEHPDYADRDILEAMTRNGAWEEAQNQAALCPGLYPPLDNSSTLVQVSLLAVLGAFFCLL